MLNTADNFAQWSSVSPKPTQTRTWASQKNSDVNPTQFLVKERVIFEPNLFYRYKNMKLHVYLRSFYSCIFTAFTARHFFVLVS